MVEENGTGDFCKVHEKPITIKKREIIIMGKKVFFYNTYCPDCELLPKHNRDEIEWFEAGEIIAEEGNMKLKINPPKIKNGSFSKIRIIFEGNIAYNIDIPSDNWSEGFYFNLDDSLNKRYKKGDIISFRAHYVK